MSTKQALMNIVLIILLNRTCPAQDSVMVKFYWDGPYSYMLLWYPGETRMPSELHQPLEGINCKCYKDTLQKTPEGKLIGKSISFADTVVFQTLSLCDTLLNRIRNSCKLSENELAIRKKARSIIGDDNKEFLHHLNNTKPNSVEIRGYCMYQFDSLLSAWNQLNEMKIDSIKAVKYVRLHLIADGITEPDSTFIRSFLNDCHACPNDLLLLMLIVEKSPDLFVQTLNEIPQHEITRLIPDMSAIDQTVIRILIRDLKKSQVHGRTKRFLVRYFKNMRL